MPIPPVLLDYRDGEVADADFAELVAKVVAHMDEVNPDVVITFGPTGITDHPDHKTMHLATEEAFQRYTGRAGNHARLLYFAIPPEIAREFELELEGPEAVPNVVVDISDVLNLKLKALRIHGSQMDIQEMTDRMEAGMKWDSEPFHQALPLCRMGRSFRASGRRNLDTSVVLRWILHPDPSPAMWSAPSRLRKSAPEMALRRT